MDNDKLVTCRRCGGNACYEQNLPENVLTYLCFGCGFSTSTLMTEGSELTKSTFEVSPELYKDIQFKDQEGLYWFPSTITVPDKGMVFLDGTTKDNWGWSGVKVVRIQEEEKDKYPKDQQYKMDNSSKKTFGQKDFMDALQYIGFFEVN